MKRLELRALAQSDLKTIGQYSVDTFGASVARDYLGGLHQSFQRIVGHPQSAPVFSKLRPTIRVLQYRRHRIFFEIVDERVIIIRILHKAMDADRHLRV